jgi:hypothetical protein
MRGLLAAFCVVLFAAAGTLTATAANLGRVVTTVTSSSGQPIARASVSVVGNPWSYHGSTDASGTMVAGAVEPGIYTVTAQAGGFQSIRITGLIVLWSQTKTVNLILSPTQH